MATPNLTFGVKSQNVTFPVNRSAPLVTGTINSQNLGNASTNIPTNAFNGHTIIISPTGAVGGSTYTLPTASQIINDYGVNQDSGIPKLSAGAMHNIHIVNRGTAPGYIVSNPTGGDGSAVIAYPATGGNFNGLPLGTGAVALSGKLTNLYVLWTNIASGTNGITGSYSIF